MLVPRCAGVESLVQGPLHVLDDEGPVVDALSHVCRQPHIILLPDDTLYRVARHGTLDGERFASDGRNSRHRANMGQPWGQKRREGVQRQDVRD